MKSELVKPVPTLHNDGKLTLDAVMSKLSEEPHFVAITSGDDKFEGLISSTNLDKITGKDGIPDVQRAIVKRDKVIYATQQDSLDDVARKMKQSRNRILPVLNNDAIVGIVISYDILQKMRREVHIQV